MCGIAIQLRTHLCNPERISHRGIVQGFEESGDYKMFHYKLPLQTGIDDEFNQPIKLKNGNYLLFNGEIFNYPDVFRNDVHYLTDFFSQDNWLESIGGDEYNTWDGFWAICIVSENKMYAFTDPLGKKQLYYRDGCISSEIKPLMNENHLELNYFSFDEIKIGPYTPFQEIYRIIPNVLHSFNGTAAATLKYNLFDLARKPKSFDLMGLIHESVRTRLINRLDSNTLFISGGLDSTIILHHIHRLGVLKDFELITIDNAEDSEYISLIESYFDCEIKRIPEYYLDNEEIESIIKAYEYPLERGSLFQQFRLCENSEGSVLYSGDGADELFSGYRRALENDSQMFDVFTELPYYHNIRLDRISMIFTKENRSPFLGHEVVRYALNCPYEHRKGKQILRDLYTGLIPQEIIDRGKVPLRESQMFDDRIKYTSKIKSIFKKVFNGNTN